MSGPLEGVRIIDLTAVISGPLSTMTLADQGADVIKIETPYGDYARHVATRRGGFSASFLNNNRNKRSVTLDLKQPAGLAALKRLCSTADVFVQNFRPGVADRIGVGEDAIREVQPQIVYAAITGFGFAGPYSQKPTYDPLIQAVSGLTTIQGGSDEDRPRLVRTIVPDKLTAIQASQAITAALFSRLRTGEGQRVNITMLDTVVSFMWSSDMGGHTFIGDEMEVERAQSYIDLIYETSDRYISVAVMLDKQWQAFARASNREDILDDVRFKTAELREENKDDRLNLIQEILLTNTSEYWLEQLASHDVPCAPVLTRKDMIRHPQIETNETIIEMQHPDAGPLRQTQQPGRFSKTPTKIRFGAPRHGQHTVEVLRESGFNEDEIESLCASGAAQTDEQDA